MKRVKLLVFIMVCLSLTFILFGCMAMMVPNNYTYGKNLYNQGNVDAARQYFENPKNFKSYSTSTFWLCKIYSDTRDYAKAVKSCDDALKSWRPLQLSGDAYVDQMNRDYYAGDLDKSWWVNRLADAYSGTGQNERAVEVVKQYVTTDNPNDAGWFVYLSQLYNLNKQYDEGIAAAKRAIELKPDQNNAYNNLGWAYMEKKQYGEAYNALKKAIEIAPDNSSHRTNMGWVLMNMDDYAGAAEAFKKASELAPGNPGDFFSLANAYGLMGRYDDALEAANEAIKLQTITGVGVNISIEAPYPVVKAVNEAGPAKKAGVEVGDKIVGIDGKKTRGWKIEQVIESLRGDAGTQVALTVERKGINKPVERVVAREIIIGKEASPAFALRGLIYRYKGNREEELKDSEKAYSLDTANDWSRISRGTSYLDLGKYDESIKILSQVKDSYPARVLEATAYVKQGDVKEAADIYANIAEKISPKNVPVMSDRTALLNAFRPFVKEHMERAGSFESSGQHKEALAEISEALRMADDNMAAGIQETLFDIVRRNPMLSEMPEESRKYALRSEVMIKDGNFEQAAAEIKKAIQVAPYVARLYYNSALINAALKKYPEAIRDMQTYLRAVPDAPDARAAKDEVIKWEFLMEKGAK